MWLVCGKCGAIVGVEEVKESCTKDCCEMNANIYARVIFLLTVGAAMFVQANTGSSVSSRMDVWRSGDLTSHQVVWRCDSTKTKPQDVTDVGPHCEGGREGGK